jgi:hypothetical protein
MREIVVKGVPLTVNFWFYPEIEATEGDPGCSAEIEIDAVFVDEFDIYNLMGLSSLQDVEDELWKIYNEGEAV